MLHQIGDKVICVSLPKGVGYWTLGGTYTVSRPGGYCPGSCIEDDKGDYWWADADSNQIAFHACFVNAHQHSQDNVQVTATGISNQFGNAVQMTWETLPIGSIAIGQLHSCEEPNEYLIIKSNSNCFEVICHDEINATYDLSDANYCLTLIDWIEELPYECKVTYEYIEAEKEICICFGFASRKCPTHGDK